MDNIEKIDLNNIDWMSSREFFDSIRDELGKLDDKDESYDFTWVGKRKSIAEAAAPINKLLRPDMEASKNFDDTKNMLIVGDNLDALKLLQSSYLGKVKMIYIDPPYNTGHDFVYHDNFTTKATDYSDSTTDEDGNKLTAEDPLQENFKSNGRFHSDWLSMMYPRLKLSRNLLTDDGVIFISIDENEISNMKNIASEIFGEENHIGTISWRRSNSQANIGMFSTVKDYILIYAKNISDVSFGRLPLSETAKKEYQYADNIGRYARTPLVHLARGRHRFEVTLPNSSTINGPWMVTEMEFNRLKEQNLLHWPENGGNPMKKVYLKDQLKKGQIANDFWDSSYGNNKLATEEIKELFNGISYFDNPKPTLLLKNILNLGADRGGLVLDFFAGSGTTGHAVMDLNAEDGGNRKYILVQIDEPTTEKFEAKKAGYDTIDQITAERLRRAGNKIKQEHPEANIDTGFRVYRIDDSNEKDGLRRTPRETDQTVFLDAVDNLKSDRSPLDLLFGVIYVSALPFDLKLETRKIGDNTVYLYGYLDEGTGLVACFDDDISENTIKEIAKLNALTAAFKDSSFADSSAKINLSEHFHILAHETKVKVV